ncbi:MAG: insulinase family protein [Actinomycetota bacterium]|nr:insulinase family protein [Actinomycetota bacterium]
MKFDDYHITELDNGLKIISEKIPHFRSISLGFWIFAGSRSENKTNNGITHLIEHLLFKGTTTRSYLDIAVAFDSLGAEYNAFTDKENSCFYADFIDSHLQKMFTAAV